MNEPSRTPAEAALQRSRNLLIALLFLGTIINYVDRQVLSLLKPSIEAAYGWGDAARGGVTVTRAITPLLFTSDDSMITSQPRRDVVSLGVIARVTVTYLVLCPRNSKLARAKF